MNHNTNDPTDPEKTWFYGWIMPPVLLVAAVIIFVRQEVTFRGRRGWDGLHLEGLDATSLAIAFCGGALALLGYYVLPRDARYQPVAPMITTAGLVVLVIALACIIAL